MYPTSTKIHQIVGWQVGHDTQQLWNKVSETAILRLLRLIISLSGFIASIIYMVRPLTLSKKQLHYITLMETTKLLP